jgi:D-alanyl-D-alanine carboxypeptidase
MAAIGVFILPTTATPGFAQGLDSAKLSLSLDSLVAQLRTDIKIPGLTILVAEGPKAVFTKGYGFANLDHQVPAGPETVYGIGSITKQFVAAAVLRLAEEGRVRLDDQVSRYLPEFSVPAGPATLHHLLSHTSGIHGGATYPGPNPDRIDYSRTELVRTLADLYKSRPPEFSPGEVWEYQSINYLLLGLLIERVTGRTLWDYLRERFFTPLGMAATAQCDPGKVVTHRATGYVRTDSVAEGVILAPFVSPTLALGSAGLCSSAPDMLKWQRALVEHQALRAGSYARMSRPGQLNDGRRTDYGYGLVTWDLEGKRFVFHTGGVPGYTAYLAYLPANDVTVALLVNANSNIFALGPAVVRATLGLPQPRELRATEEELARYAGTYESGRLKAIVTEQDGHLSVEINGSDSFRFIFDPKLLKQRDREFAVEWEPESRLSFQVRGGQTSGATLRYGGRTVRLRRAN